MQNRKNRTSTLTLYFTASAAIPAVRRAPPGPATQREGVIISQWLLAVHDHCKRQKMSPMGSYCYENKSGANNKRLAHHDCACVWASTLFLVGCQRPERLEDDTTIVTPRTHFPLEA